MINKILSKQGRFMLASLSVIVTCLFLPSVARADIVWVAGVNDSFNRANTTAGVAGSTSGAGNGWIDVQGGIWNISGNKLIGTPEVSSSAYLRDFLIRPVSENRVNQKMVVTTAPRTATTSIWNTALRYQSDTKNTYYILMRDSGSLQIISSVEGSLSTLSTKAFSYNPLHQYRITSTATGTNPTVIDVELFNVTSSTTVATSTVSNSTPTLQGTGAYGVNVHADAVSGVSVPFSKVETYYDSTSLEVGLLSPTSIGTSTVSLSSGSATGGTSPYTYQWGRSKASGGPYSMISGATGLSVDDSGLLPNTDYYYVLALGDDSGTNATSTEVSVKTAGVYDSNFSDDFDGLDDGAVAGQNGWLAGGSGTWSVEAGGAGEKVLSQTTVGPNSYNLNYVANGSSALTDQRMTVDFNTQSTTYSPQFWLRKTAAVGDAGGYLVFHNAGSWTLVRYQAGANGNFSSTVTVASPITISTNTWYTAEVEVIDNNNGKPVITFYAYPQGTARPVTPIIRYTDASETFISGYFGLGVNTSSVSYDNMTVDYNDGSALTITSPAREVGSDPEVATLAIYDEGGLFHIPYIQTGNDLEVSATVGSTHIPSGGGVRFVLNEGLSDQRALYSIGGSSPYSVEFTDLPKGEYVLDVYVVDAGQVVQSGPMAHDRATDIGIGEIITGLGDSITAGYPYNLSQVSDWVEAIDKGGSTSIDKRNFPQHDPSNSMYKVGYAIAINDILSSYYGYPVFLMNEGWSGHKASDYIDLIASGDWRDRQLALAPSRYLVHLGVNDSLASVASTTFQSEMQSIVSSLIDSFGVSSSSVYLARPAYINGNPSSNARQQTYFPGIEEIVSSSGISTGPDFYSYYAPYYSQYYADTLHPNYAGYEVMAQLWSISLMPPRELEVTQDNNLVTVAWEDLSLHNPAINGYVLNYGTSSADYATTTDVGNVASVDIEGLVRGTTYYFSVSGYYEDATSTVVTRTPDSSETTFLFAAEVPPQLEVTMPASSSSRSGGRSSVRSTPASVPVVRQETPSISSVSPATRFEFSRDLTVGSEGDDVRSLQAVLISKGYLTGGTDTGFFGPVTQDALARYQLDRGIYPSAGYFGPLTRSSFAVSTGFARNLTVGSFGDDVRELQRHLNKHGFTVAEYGPGSVGSETLYFGDATRTALARFQTASGISPALGFLGPLTRAYIQAMSH